MDNKNADDGTQIAELLEKITETVAANGFNHFVPDKKIHLSIEEKRLRVEDGARLRQSQVKARRNSLKGSKNKLRELRIVLLGMKTSGKSATGNNLLRKGAFATCQNNCCQVEEEEVADRLITVIDTPGWSKSSECIKEMDKEIVRGLSVSPLGVHAVLLVVPSDLTFREAQQVALEEHMNLFDASIWKHTMVLFTYGDKLADKSIEEHIEREHRALRWLVDKCENKYHVVNNMKKSDMSQVTELFEKIEEMVAGNNGRLYCPDMNDVHHRIEEKFRRRQLKNVLKQRLEEEYRRRELELMINFKETLLELQADNKESVTSTKSKSLNQLVGDMAKLKVKAFGQRKKEENTDAKINHEIEKLDKEIMRSTELLRNSKEFLMPDLKGESRRSSIAESYQEGKMPTGQFDNVLQWLSTLQISKNAEDELTLNFSQTSGYRSVLPQDEFYAEADIPE
ncbi:GTPase IMAP family member 7-like [Larimichthys crocea]|uniref:GTPase IMAP family member 7-like n=1 Tax=Larimichthys crocea TaxID=215358 RepID=UPI000F5DB5DE|nr:GTPase IMAP family member 7-like [Larimichthys crocea]